MQNYLHLDILPGAAKFTGKEIATILEHITNLLTYGEDEQKSNPFPFKWPQALSERLEQNERLLLQELSLKDRFTMFVADPIDTYIFVPSGENRMFRVQCCLYPASVSSTTFSGSPVATV